MAEQNKKNAKKPADWNPYDENFNWNEEDPMLSVKIDFEYVQMTTPINKKITNQNNYGFYWMYPCEN